MLISTAVFAVIGAVMRKPQPQITNTKSSNLNTIDVLWQDASRWDWITAKKVAAINPSRFVVNIDGPYSHHTPTTGPHPDELVGFISELVVNYGWKGKLVMHPDCNLAEFKADWSNGNAWDSSGWKLYADYMKVLNDALHTHGLPTFTELLIETEGSGMTGKANVQNAIFDNFRNYINDSSIQLSATSDWNKKSFPTSADYYYAQMYDMCYDLKDGGIPELCGVNDPKVVGRATKLAVNMVENIRLDRLDKVSFIFTYAPNKRCPSIKLVDLGMTNPSICRCPHFRKPYCPTLDAPMFGGDPLTYWSKSEFLLFANKFKGLMKGNYTSIGIWHCESPLKNW